MNECGLYLHIPFCKKRCGYCNFFSSINNEEIQEKYIKELNNEIYQISQKNKEINIKTIYLGGGTPSLISLINLESVFNQIYKNFSIKKDVEITIEVNPESSCFIDNYPEFGINRISIGIQSTDDILLKKIGRLHSAKEGIECLQKASENFDNVSADLILGLDENQNVSNEFNNIYKYVKHISAYILTLEEKTELYKKILSNTVSIATEDRVIDQYNYFYDIAEENGFKRYETSNYSIRGYESRHNSSYWDLTPYIGLGAGAHSFYNGIRYYNTENINDYINGIHSGNSRQIIERESSESDDKIEYIMLSLRTTNGLNFKDYKCKFNSDFMSEFSDKIKKSGAYLNVSNEHINILPDYFLVQNEIIRSIIY